MATTGVVVVTIESDVVTIESDRPEKRVPFIFELTGCESR